MKARVISPTKALDAPAGITVTPGGSAYRARLGNGSELSLSALHIVSKELRDWLWITLWWSDTPNEDFGEDRPAELGEPWNHVKMYRVPGRPAGVSTFPGARY